MNAICGSAGIGRQAGLRCLCPTIDVWVQVPSPAPKKTSVFELMSFFSLLVDNGTEPVDQKDRNGHFNQIRKYKREHACGESSQ